MIRKIQLRRGNSAQWAAANPVLLIGEMGVETDTRRHKFGDGINTWTSLSYGTSVPEFIQSGTPTGMPEGVAVLDDAGYLDSSLTPQANSILLNGLDGYARITGGDNGFAVYWKEESAAPEKWIFDIQNTSSFTIAIANATLTGNRNYTLPDKNGVFAMTSDLDAKQPTLVSGTNIRTVNGNSLLGSTDLVIEAGASLLTPASDTAKLALTGIVAGQVVRITGEGNRIEQYLGGTISSQSSWAVLRNTVQLSVAIISGSGDTVVVNGASVPNSSTPTAVGWVDPSAVSMSAAASAVLSVGTMTSRTTLSNLQTTAVLNNSISLTPTAQNHTLPAPVPQRGIVQLNVTYPTA